MLSDILKYPLVFLIGLGITLILTPLIGKIARSLGLVDEPGTRRIHNTAIPRCGGVSIFIAFHIAGAFVVFMPWGDHLGGSLGANWWTNYLWISSILLLVGLLDDAFVLPWAAKLLGQIIPALLLFWCGIRMGQLQGWGLSPSIDLILTVIWFLAFTNAFNLIDGMDGLATGLAMIASLGIAGASLFRHLPGETLILLGLIGACLGFLKYNFHPAKIFLGDSGSMFLGFTLAAVSLSTTTKGATIASLCIPLLAIGVPVFDTLLAIWRRSVRSILSGRKGSKFIWSIAKADMDHVHHRLIAAGFNQRRTATILYFANACLVIVGLLSMAYNSHAVGIFLIAFVIGAYAVVRHLAHVELWDTGNALLDGLKRPRSPVIAAILYPVFDFVALFFCFTATIFLTSAQLTYVEFRETWISTVPFWCGVPYICLFFSGSYSRVWSRARISEFVITALSLFAGIILSAGMSLLWESYNLRELAVKALLYFGLAATFVTGLRALPRAIQDMMELLSKKAVGGKARKRIMIYGAGLHCVLYLKEIGASVLDGAASIAVVGLLDDDTNLRRRFVHGYRVLGTGAELSRILSKHPVDEIVLTSELGEAKFQNLLDICTEKNIALTRWSLEAKVIHRVNFDDTEGTLKVLSA